MSEYPPEGQPAPDFELDADDGSKVRLSDLHGRKVVLYFYPKDDTPGCTTQACGLRDQIKDFDARDAIVFGVSADTVASHVRFRDKYSLPFRLLADVGHKVADQYGVWKQKSFLGKKYWGIERTSFVIDEAGRIARVLPRV
ncbi:MAG TPA: thioredoxin-dependent thiol peroxidase, partial [Longimicrobiales bacterium]|nr:thioredoxin-dependent thiol peroxidase [Longimicrobiales bacterium]